MTSTLQRSEIQSKMAVDVSVDTLVAATEKVLAYGNVPNSKSQLFMLKNISADGGILTSLRIEAFADEADGTEVSLDANNVPVRTSTIDAGTGVGTPLNAAQLAALPFTVVKDRIGMRGQTSTDTVSDPNRLTGDAGSIGNTYCLEVDKAEYGFQADEDGKAKPKFYRVVVEVAAAGGDVALVTIEDTLDFLIPPATPEVVA